MSKNVQIFLCMPSIDVILNFENIKSAIWPLWKITKTHYKNTSCIIVTFYLFWNKIPQNSITLEFINLWKVFWLLWVNFICKKMYTDATTTCIFHFLTKIKREKCVEFWSCFATKIFQIELDRVYQNLKTGQVSAIFPNPNLKDCQNPKIELRLNSFMNYR